MSSKNPSTTLSLSLKERWLLYRWIMGSITLQRFIGQQLTRKVTALLSTSIIGNSGQSTSMPPTYLRLTDLLESNQTSMLLTLASRIETQLPALVSMRNMSSTESHLYSAITTLKRELLGLNVILTQLQRTMDDPAGNAHQTART